MIGWRRRIPFVQQLGPTDCGLACLTMVARYHGIAISQEELADRIGTSEEGASAAGLVELARQLRLRVVGVRLELSDLTRLPTPAILHWEFRHFVVLDRARRSGVDIVDPSSGPRRVSHDECRRCFTGVALSFENDPAADRARTPRRGVHPAKHLRPNHAELRDFASTISASVLVHIFALAVPFFVGTLVDQVIPLYDIATFKLLLGVAGTAVVLSLFAQLVRGLAGAHLRARLSMRLGQRFVSHLLALPFTFFERRPCGDLIDRIRSNAAIRDIVSGTAISALLDGIFVVLYFALLLLASPRLALAAGLLAGMEMLIFLVCWRRRRELIATKLRETANTTASEVEMFAALEAIKGLGLEQRALDRWTRTYGREVGATLALSRVDVWVASLRAGLALAAPIVLLGLGAQQVLLGALSVGMMLAVNSLALGLLHPLSSLFAAASQLQTVAGHLERIDGVLSRAPERESARDAPSEVHEIRLEHVSYRHGSAGTAAVDDVSLIIPAGATVALVGRSGAGKTTLARLIAGLYEPKIGEVRIGDLSRTAFGARAFRSRVGYVPQEARLFGPTIRDELTLGRPDASMREVVAIAESVGIHREIMQMTLQYATPIVDGTVGLSGGQRQRIALARALMRRPALLVLDEATSALDAHAEADVYRCVSQLECTRVIVAHRLSTIRNADLVVVLDRGHIVELGAPDELARAGGNYARLIARQLDGVTAGDACRSPAPRRTESEVVECR